MAELNTNPFNLSTQDLDRFYRYVDLGETDVDCWEWQGTHDNHGYGVLKVRGKTLKAHRIAYAAHYRCDPALLCVCHKCDNPPCCNPTHLFLGTSADNTRDSTEKGRRAKPKGEQVNGARLNATQVLEIRAIYESQHIRQDELATRYGVSRRTISAIVSRTNWNHLSNPDGTITRPPRKRVLKSR